MAGEGVNGIQEGESRRGVRGLDWHLNAGGRAARGDRMRRGEVATGLGSASAGRVMELMSRPHMAVT
jgi:hypothetical protein